MTWIAPSDNLTGARDAMRSTAAARLLGISAANAFNYPEAGLKTTALPFVVLADERLEYERNAPGESFGTGEVKAVLYLDPGTITQGAAETAAAEMCRQLCESDQTNLFIIGASRSLASRVRRSKVAASVDGAARQYFTIEISFRWEG